MIEWEHPESKHQHSGPTVDGTRASVGRSSSIAGLPAGILALQRTCGNRAVQQMLGTPASRSTWDPSAVPNATKRGEEALASSITALDRQAGNLARNSLPPVAPPVHSAPSSANLVPTNPISQAAPTVQRKFGFEFQSVANAFKPGGGAAAVGEKERVYEDKDGFFRVEGDNATQEEADLEFVTTATESVPDALAAVTGASLLAKTLAEQQSWDVRPGSAPYQGTWLRPAHMRIADPKFCATPQATIGIPLDRLPNLLRNILMVPVARQAPVGKTLRGMYAEAHAETLQNVNTRTATWADERKLSPAVHGLLTMVAMYIEKGSRSVEKTNKATETSVQIDGQWWELGTADGPKASFELMARTSFRAAFNSLSDADQEVFRELMTPKAARAAVGLESYFGDKLAMTDRFPRTPYLADTDKVRNDDGLRDSFRILKVSNGKILPNGKHEQVYVVTEGPTVQQWLTSICTDVSGHDRAGRDLMSPPIGYGKRDPQLELQHKFPQTAEIRKQRLYGMGAYPMDERVQPGRDPESLFIAEIRGFSSMLQHYDMEANPPADKWLDTAKIALNHHFAALLTESEATFWAGIKDNPQLVKGVGMFRYALSTLYQMYQQQADH